MVQKLTSITIAEEYKQLPYYSICNCPTTASAIKAKNKQIQNYKVFLLKKKSHLQQHTP